MSKGPTPKRLKGDNPPKDFRGNQEQFEKFLDAAKKAGTNDDPAVFDKLIAGIASTPKLSGQPNPKRTKKPTK